MSSIEPQLLIMTIPEESKPVYYERINKRETILSGMIVLK